MARVKTTPPPAPDVRAQTSTEPVMVPLDLIADNPYQPRQAYDDERIVAIAASIREHGLLQIPIARRTPIGALAAKAGIESWYYQLAFGHTRLRAYRLLADADPLRWREMPLLLRDLDDETMALHAWTENKDRKDLSAYEEAQAIARYTQHFGWTQQQAAERLKLDRSTISNKLRLLKLPESALAQLRTGELSERQAVALLPLVDVPETSEKVWTGQGYFSVPRLLELAPTLNSATLRQYVDSYFDAITIALAKQPWAATPMPDVAGVRAAACADCPVKLKGNRCPDKQCADRKRSAYLRQQAEAAAVALGLPAVAPGGQHSAWCDELQGVRLTAIQEMAASKGCGRLSVVCDPGHAWWPHSVEGHPNCKIVCAHGEGKRCACKAALSRSGQPEVSTESRQRVERQRIKGELLEPAAATLTTVLTTDSPALWRLFLARVDRAAAAKLPDDADRAAILQALAAALLAESVRYCYEYSPDYPTAKRQVAHLLERLGAALPWEPEPKGATAEQGAALVGLLGSITALRTRIAGGERSDDLHLAVAELWETLDGLADVLDDPAYQQTAAQISELEEALAGVNEVAA